ncbi:MAG: AAA family ATPase [Burkholderiales bacterium]|nr:AAA family ATPase [Burkholderiales bacterium]
MKIKKIKIINFKCFNGEFTLDLNDGITILVGDNEAGKSTILEAINLALTGMFHGKALKNELSQYIFNYEILTEYFNNIKEDKECSLPEILIELYLEGTGLAIFEGSINSNKEQSCGISFKIAFDEEKYKNEYQILINSEEEIKTLPIEYYDIFWRSFAYDNITSRSIPIKAAMIDSSNMRHYNGSDIYISRIIQNSLIDDDVICISQAHRKMLQSFMQDESIAKINEKVINSADISNKNIKLSIEMVTKNGWQNNLIAYLDNIPFHFIGKGEQCLIKTKLALSHEKTKKASVMLIEEPENHLSHSKLNEFICSINQQCENRQVIISTHSSFIANKLGLKHLVLLNKNQFLNFNSISDETKNFFAKLPGYDTLRLLLCKKAILVEGDCDELIVQKAYMVQNNNRLPIQDGIDIISVGTTFLRFLEIAKQLKTSVAVVTDNDGDIENKINKKYSDYLGKNKKDNITICYDTKENTCNLTIGKEKKRFNCNTLEPNIIKANMNNLEKFNNIFGTKCKSISEMHQHMKSKKTECALKIFETTEVVFFPDYIMQAIENDKQ